MIARVREEPRISLADLMRVDGLDEYKGWEIVDGAWQPKHAGGIVSAAHGKFGKRLLRKLDDFVTEHQLGEVYMPETIFVLHVDEDGVRTVRKPDIAFVKQSRLIEKINEYYAQAPDLAVEVISPSDTPAVLHRKLTDYLTYGTEQVWLFHPIRQRIVVHHADGTAYTYNEADTITGGELLPGFQLRVGDLFI